MGYDLHITRVDDWAESETRPIELEEWLAYAEASPDLTRDESYGAGDERGFFNLRIGGVDTWLAWSDGRIYSKNPSGPVRVRMHEVARAFDAQVQGDDGELYDERGEVIPNEEVTQPSITPRGALLGMLALAPLLFVINSPLVALASLLMLVAVVVLSFVIFDGLVAVAVTAAAVVALLAWMVVRATAY